MILLNLFKVIIIYAEKQGMKYHSQLTEATLLKRHISFLTEVVLQSKRRIMLRCPNLGSLLGCDILGTQLWFSAPYEDHCLPTLELVEVNDGYLVSINPEILKPLVIEAIKLGNIKELSNYKIINPDSRYEYDSLQFLMLEHPQTEQCYVYLEQVIHGTDQNEGLFPLAYKSADRSLEHLILRKQQGHRSVLLYCVVHSGIKTLKFADQFDPEYSKKVAHAVEQGVEILAYKAKITTKEIELISKLPITLPEDLRFKI